MENTISLCMIMKDEEKNIRRCLQSVQGLVDEIIAIDTGSSDKTVDIAREFGATVRSFIWNGSFSDARNASLELAKGKWILFLDADEAIAPGSGPVLRQLSTDNTCEGYLLKIISYMGNESCSQWSTDMVFRLFRNRPEYRFRGAVHEQIVDCIQECNSQAIFQTAHGVVIHHYGYLDVQVKEKDKMNRNLAIISQEVAVHPENRSVRYHYGVELFRVGQFAAAVREFELAAQGADRGQLFMPKLYNYLAHSYYRNRQPQQALAAVCNGLSLFPDHAGLHLCGGQISFDEKDYGLAYAFFAKCLTLPEQPDYYGAFSGTSGFRPCIYLALIAGKFGNEEEALRYYIQGLRDNPTHIAALDGIIRILRPREDPDYSRTALESVCEFCTAEAYLMAADILLAQGAFGLALWFYQQGLPAPQEPSRHALHKAVCLIQAEQYLEALHLLDLFIPSDPFYPLAKINILLCFWLQGNSKIVGMMADQLCALGLSDDTAAVIGLLRNTTNSRQDFSVTLGADGMAFLLDVLIRTLDLERWKYGAQLLSHVDADCLREYGLAIGRLWARYGQWAKARHYVRLYLDAHTDSAEAYGVMASLMENTGAPLEAAACYRQAITLEPREPEYYCKLYELYAAMRRDAQAAAGYGQALGMESREVEDYRQLVILYDTLGRGVFAQVQDRFVAAAQLLSPPGDAC